MSNIILFSDVSEDLYIYHQIMNLSLRFLKLNRSFLIVVGKNFSREISCNVQKVAKRDKIATHRRYNDLIGLFILRVKEGICRRDQRGRIYALAEYIVRGNSRSRTRIIGDNNRITFRIRHLESY